MPRFVVLRHDPPSDTQQTLHWDLMLETEGGLATWSLPSEPVTGSTLSATVLKEHRLDFLDFEGPLEGNRGRVSRFDRGLYETHSENSNRLIVRLRGQQFDGLATIEKNSAARSDCVDIRFDPPPG